LRGGGTNGGMSPSPLPCGVSFTTPQGGPSPLRDRGSSEPEAVKGEGRVSNKNDKNTLNVLECKENI